jgi:uncharacterized ion transporter superfamily protein YfcC
MRLKLPHPVVLLLAGIALAALMTWLIPAGEFERRFDPLTDRTIAVAGTYHEVPATPVGPFDAAVAVPRGLVAGVEIVATILFVGAAFYLVEKVGTLERLLAALVRRLRNRGMLAIPILALFFGIMGALENMQEEIIALVPVLLLFGRRLGFPPMTVVAASAGAAIVGSAFGPTNPFQAGIALTLAELPVLSGGALRLAMWVVGMALWILLTMQHAAKNRNPSELGEGLEGGPITARDWLIVACVVVPLGAYVIGALQWGWGFNELSGAFVVGAAGIGLVAKLGWNGTCTAMLEGMQAMVPAAIIVALARSISLVLTDGKVIDTILFALSEPLIGLPATASALMMVPVQALIHIPVSSVSGQAALTMPVMIPLADLIGLSRQATVLAFQTGAGLMELLTPTNGALMAVLLAAKVPFQQWLKFAFVGWMVMTAVGVAGILVAV